MTSAFLPQYLLALEKPRKSISAIENAPKTEVIPIRVVDH